MSETKRIYRFGKDAQGNNVTEGSAQDKFILGGKGANLAEMAKIGLPVPPGFTITCQTCMEYANAGNVWPEGVLDLIAEARRDLEERAGKKLGDPKDPLLVSVRSGAPFSMPGMMDTVLNLGMNDESVHGLIEQTDNPRFAWDSYRRFIQMFSDVVMGVEADLFENAITARKIAAGVKSDTELTAEDLQGLVADFKQIFSENVSVEQHPDLVGADGRAVFPQDPSVQLLLAIQAVFGSWNNSRAILYRYRDMMDIEFTIEQGKLFMLQTRVGKRTAAAALKVAIDMVGEGLISKEEALLRVDPGQLDQLLHPQFDKTASYDLLCQGLNASPGAAVGGVVFSSADAVKAAAAGQDCILVRWETNPDDLSGMVAAKGILTSHGGKTSHAAVIARGMGAPCVCGAEALKIDAAKKEVVVSGTDIVLHEGDVISIDGTTGAVVLGAVRLVSPKLSGDLETILTWADEVRKIGVEANADNPADAQLARDFGAAGIGLDRTEHMFLGDRKQIIQTYILNEDASVRAKACSDLYEAQTGDFYGMFKAMDGLPVTVRLLDPPLHEFLDDPRKLEVEITKLECTGAPAETVAAKKKLLRQIDAMVEANPMLGLRGCRLGFVYPDLPVMQVRAIAAATARLKKEGLDPKPRIMVPLVSVATELKAMRATIEGVIAEISQQEGVEFDIPVGTMIELPRAAVTADEIGKYADFFSFGTNDLTQTTFGFSRDDVEGKFIPTYLREKLITRNPFETVDDGVCRLIKIAVEKGREANPNIDLGVCGEHGGDPESIQKFFDLGLDYVSCSPYRVPVARLAAAQATLRSKK